MFKNSLKMVMLGLFFATATTATNLLPTYSSAFLENKTSFLKVPSTGFLAPVPKFILHPGLFVQRHPLITLGLTGLTGLVAYGALAYKILDRYYDRQIQPKNSKQSNDTTCKTFFGKFKTMSTLNKMRALLLSPLIFGYSFIHPETWREFAESLDLIHPSQEIKKEKKIEKKIEQKIEEKKIEDVGIELSIESSVTTEDFVNKLNEAQNIEILIIRTNEEIDFNSPTIPWNKLSNLKILDLSWTKIDDLGLKAILENCKNLKTLNLSSCENITKDGFKNARWSNLSNLEGLYLSWTKIDDLGLKAILENCKNLEILDLYSCTNITEDGFKNDPWANLSKLKSLDLSSTEINNDGLKNLISTKNVSWEILDLKGCDTITEEGFENLDWKILAPSLKELNLSLTNIGDLGLKQFFELQYTNLKKLDFHNCDNITTEAFEATKWSNIANINTLILYRSSISLEGVIKILKECEQLETLDLEACNNLDEAYRKEFSSKEEIKEAFGELYKKN